MLYPFLFYEKFTLILPMFIGQIGILFTPTRQTWALVYGMFFSKFKT